jgi:hypothetical protein
MDQGKGLAALLHFCHAEMKCDLGVVVERKGKEMNKNTWREKRKGLK